MTTKNRSRWEDVIPADDPIRSWHAGMPEPDPDMCDFCSMPVTRNTLVRFQCNTFIRRAILRENARVMLIETCHCHTPIAHQPGDDTLEQGVIGDWAACLGCADCIWADDRLGLARRAVASLHHRNAEYAQLRPLPPITRIDADTGEAHTIPAPSWEVFYVQAHDGFFLHRVAKEEVRR